MLFFLIAGHALADYSLQNGAMAVCKNRHANHALHKDVPWYYWMTAHALIHGMVVAVIIGFWTNNRDLGVLYGLMEFGIHWIIDTLKCEKLFSIHADQAFHVLCKVAWWAMVANQVISI